MATRRLAALFLAIGIAIVLPSIALAAAANPTGDSQVYGTGLVPCGVSIDPSVATECEACNLVQLIQNVITFLIGLSVPIAMAMFAYAGFLYFSSGTGGSENISKAKGIFKNAALGFALALCSWLIVNTILVTVLNPNPNTGGFTPGTWFHIDCTKRPKTTTIGEVINSQLGIAPTVTQTVTYASTCTTGEYSDKLDGCYDSTTGKYLGPPVTKAILPNSGAASDPNLSSEISSACSSANFNDCALAQSISQNESSGGANCPTSPTGAVGCMQMLATTACSIQGSINGCSACLQSQNSLSQQCQPVASAIADPTLNTQLAVTYISQLYAQNNGSCSLTAAAYYQGQGNVNKYHGVPPNAVDYASKACGN